MGELNCTLEERTRTLNYALTVEMLDVNTNASLITEGGLVGANMKSNMHFARISFHF